MRVDRAMRRAIVALLLAMASLAAPAAFDLSTSPAQPEAGKPFDLVVSGDFSVIILIADAITITGNTVDVVLTGDCGFLCPGAGPNQFRVRMPALPAGEYLIRASTPGRPFIPYATQVQVTVGAAAPRGLEDLSDLWYRPDESGWGLSLHQQGDIGFANLFAYDAQGKSQWLVAPDLRSVEGVTPPAFRGVLYRTTGPAFDRAAFDPAAVGVQPVGGMIVSAPGDGTLLLEYSVDGTTIVKRSLVRQTWRPLTGAATYTGGLALDVGACQSLSRSVLTQPATFSASFDGTKMSLRYTAGRGRFCTFTGEFHPTGRSSEATGTYACDPAQPVDAAMISGTGTMSLSSIERTTGGFSARFAATGFLCEVKGDIGGVRTR